MHELVTACSMRHSGVITELMDVSEAADLIETSGAAELMDMS